MEFESIDVETFRFDVVRKGYDRLQVEDFQNKVSKNPKKCGVHDADGRRGICWESESVGIR